MEKTIPDSTPWISIGKYAKKYKLGRSKLYMDFYFGRLGNRAKKIKVEKETILILDLPPGDKNEIEQENGLN